MADTSIKDLSYSYAEILEVFKYTDKTLVEKIPKKMINLFENKASKDYQEHLTDSLPLQEQPLAQDTYGLLALIYSNYWCENQEQKDELNAILEENERKLNSKENKETFEIQDEETIDQVQETNENLATESNGSNLPMDYSNMVWYQKIVYKLKGLVSNLINMFKGKKANT